MGLLQAMAEAYDLAFFKTGDPRVRDWPLLGSPVPLFAILAFYLYVIKVGAPRYMRTRPPFHLKTVITLYNVFQVIANACIFHGLLTYGWTDKFDLGCYMPDYSNNPTALRMASIVWYELCLKIIDLVETIFFILRGKEKQASFLHIYHHVATVLIVYTGAKYVPGGYATFSMMVNNLVHVLMYTYYLLSLLGPRMQKTLGKVKRYLTILQMIQFAVILTHYFYLLLTRCNLQPVLRYFFAPYVLLVFYLFLDFYRTTYVPKKAE